MKTRRGYIYSGGVMKKKKLLTILLLCLGLAGWASAVEVINIDINNYNDDTAYVGEGAYVDGGVTWIVYYGGWGIAVGSQRSADLVNDGDGAAPGTYAEQVWIGDPGGHGYISGSALLDDGFVNSNPSDTFIENPTSDPNNSNIAFFGQGAYGGTFDMYVYGDSAGEFIIADGNDILGQASVTGTVSGFVAGQNYVVFQDVPLGNPNMIRLYYSNELNGIQLVSNKVPFTVVPSTDPNDNLIEAQNYDVAYETNSRSGEFNPYGPDIGNGFVSYLDTGEYMEYDLAVDNAAQGQYAITMGVTTTYSNMSMEISLDGTLLGTLTSPQREGDENIYETDNSVIANLFEGTRVLKWEVPQVFSNIAYIKMGYIGPITLETCDDVYLYGLQPAGDINEDCIVDIQDLAEIAAVWAVNYDPEAQ